MNRVFLSALIGFSAVLPVAATAQSNLALQPGFRIEGVNIFPTGEKTTRGGYGKNYILKQRYAPDRWVAIEGDAAVQSGAITHSIKAGEILTGFKSPDGTEAFCALKTLRVRSDVFGEFDHYIQLTQAVPCLVDGDHDGRFETARIAFRDTSTPSAYWEFTRLGAATPLAQPVGYRDGTTAERPYGSINFFLLTIPFSSGYYLSIQDVMIGGSDLTGFSPNLVPEIKDGPVSFSRGKFRIDVKSRKGGVFTYNIVSGFDGESYPGFGETP